MSERTEKIRIIADETGNFALRLIADELESLKSDQDAEQLRIQLRCGVTDPRTDATHPGYLLLALGWEYEPGDEYGCEWSKDGSRVTLAMALGEELRVALRADTLRVGADCESGITRAVDNL